MSNELSEIKAGQPVALARATAATQRLDNPVAIAVSIGAGPGTGKAWGCDLSYDYVKINAEYTT